MTVTSAQLIYFSPTRTTRKILEGIAHGLQGITVDQADLTPPAARAQGFAAVDRPLALIGVPVYSGRVPVEAVDRLRRLGGHVGAASKRRPAAHPGHDSGPELCAKCIRGSTRSVQRRRRGSRSRVR